MATNKSAEFSDYINQVVRYGYISLGLSVGSRLDLFKLMSSFNEPKTAQEIADAGGFKERYVREWLNLMAVAKIVTVDEEGQRFLFPKEYHETLVGDFTPADEITMLPMVSKMEDTLIDCFSKTGPRGFSYSLLTRYPFWMRKFNIMRLKMEGDVYKDILKLADKLEKGAMVADMGCGEGTITMHLAKLYPNSIFHGLDFGESVINKGRSLVSQEGLKNIHLAVQDMCCLPPEWENKWDCIMMHFSVHDVPDTSKAFEEAIRTLKPGGMIVVCEMNAHTNVAQNLDSPIAVGEYCVSMFSCVPCSMVEGGEGFGSLWGKELAMEMISNAGFKDVNVAYEGPISVFMVGTK